MRMVIQTVLLGSVTLAAVCAAPASDDADGNVKIDLGAVHSMGSKTGPSGMMLLFR